MIERLQMWLSWKAPRWLVYWCVVRCGAEGTTGKHSNQVVPELTVLDAMKRWKDGDNAPQSGGESLSSRVL